MLYKNPLNGFKLHVELNLFMNNFERNQAQIIVGKQIQFLVIKSI